MTVAELIKGFIAALLSRCPKCWGPLDCIRDWSGGVEGYGLYYCPKCDKIQSDFDIEDEGRWKVEVKELEKEK